MNNPDLAYILQVLAGCAPELRLAVFNELRRTIQLHRLEVEMQAPAEMILEAIHRAPELTRRMLRGVIADAAFAQYVVPALVQRGWRDVMPPGNHSYDHALADQHGQVRVQVKLQRSEKQEPVITTGTRYGLGPGMFMVEVQRTRGGNRRSGDMPGFGEGEEVIKTRPYRYGEFDLIAVSLYPSTGRWDLFRYTVGNWLRPGKGPNEIATYQPVARTPNDDWTDNLEEAAFWLRTRGPRRIRNGDQMPFSLI